MKYAVKRAIYRAGVIFLAILATNASTIAQPRIIGGTNADPNRYAWTTRISLYGSFMCSGSLIDPGGAQKRAWVLTAAHCVAGVSQSGVMYYYPTSQFEVMIGATDFTVATSNQKHKVL